jgi:predicted exporter
VLVLFAMVLCLAGIRFYGHKLDTSIVSLFPDSSPELARVGNLLEFTPGGRAVFVELTSDNDDAGATLSAKLHAAAAQIQTDMRDLLYEPNALAPSPAALLTLLPPLFDENMETLLAPRLEAQEIQQRLATLREGLSGYLALMPKEYIQTDPLNFRDALAGRFHSAEPDNTFGRSLFDKGLSLAPDGRSALLLLQPLVSLNDTAGAKIFMNRLEAALKKAAPPKSGISALVAGGLEFTAHNTIAIEHDLKLTIPLSLALIALIYAFTVRSLAAMWLLFTPLAAVIFAGSAMSLLWPVTAGLALGFGAAVLGLAEDYAVLVHFALRSNSRDKAKTLIRAARPMGFSALLCIGSFCVLMLSSIPALRQLGFFAAFSLACGFGIALFVLPLCPWIDKPALKTSARPADSQLRPNLIRTGALALACLFICVFGVYRIPFDASFQSQGADSDNLQTKLHELRTRWQLRAEPQIWASSGATLDEALQNAASLAATLRSSNALPVFSLADVLPPPEERSANITRWNNFVHRHQNLDALLEKAAQETGFKKETFAGFTNWFSVGYTPPINALDNLRQAGLGQLLWWMLLEKHGAFHVLTIGGSGAEKISGDSTLLSSSALGEGLNQALRHEIFLLPLAGVFCLLMLFLCFRRPTLVLLACLPPLFGLTSITAWLLVSGRHMTLTGVAALVLVIGLGADYGIVMLHELHSRLSLGAFRSILVSGLTTLAGLGVLILAQHPVLQTLGGVTFFGLVAEMAAVLLIVLFLCNMDSRNA